MEEFIERTFYKAWLINLEDSGSYHREDGPAIIWKADNEEWWCLNGKRYYPDRMPLSLFLAYIKWEYKKLNGN